MDIKQILASKKPIIDKMVFKLLPEKHNIPEIQTLYNMMRDYPKRGGKRLRPVLILLATKMFGGNEKDALTSAASLELFHDWVLIHDDIEDGSETRRGDPCLHHKYNLEMALNAGDACHLQMWKALVNQKLPEEIKSGVLDAFAELLFLTTTGQAMEIDWFTNNKWDIKGEDYIEMATRKTAYYTAASPLYIGAIIAGKADYVDKIFDFGKPFGLAFQIQDDILDLTADKKFGKQHAGDIYEGKRTLMIVHLLQNMDEQEKKRFFEIMNKKRKDKTQEEVDEILSLMKKHKSIEYAKQKALDFANEALKKFDKHFADVADSEEKQAIRAFVTFVIEREM
jgi:geranylgeranyl diphosphate synthase type II